MYESYLKALQDLQKTQNLEGRGGPTCIRKHPRVGVMTENMQRSIYEKKPMRSIYEVCPCSQKHASRTYMLLGFAKWWCLACCDSMPPSLRKSSAT